MVYPQSYHTQSSDHSNIKISSYGG
ncbi:hypothetical protein BN183_3680007 [Clostridioides difficile E7]|nr:hypothetical protein BN183_3680007 [Clostridioides difficile E7]